MASCVVLWTSQLFQTGTKPLKEQSPRIGAVFFVVVFLYL